MHGMEHVKLNNHNQISHHKGAPLNSEFFRNLALTFIIACYTHLGNPVTTRTNVWCLFSTYIQRRWPHVFWDIHGDRIQYKSSPADVRVRWFKHTNTQ